MTLLIALWAGCVSSPPPLEQPLDATTPTKSEPELVEHAVFEIPDHIVFHGMKAPLKPNVQVKMKAALYDSNGSSLGNKSKNLGVMAAGDIVKVPLPDDFVDLAPRSKIVSLTLELSTEDIGSLAQDPAQPLAKPLILGRRPIAQTSMHLVRESTFWRSPTLEELRIQNQ